MPSKKHKCFDCDNLCMSTATRCYKCSAKFRRGVRKNYCIDCGMKIYPYKSTRCPKCSSNGEKNGQWKGEMVGYGSLHEWVKNHKPKPKFCEECKKNKPFDLANISGKYKRDINDFEWLCRSCHMKKDGRMGNLKQNRKRCWKCGEIKEVSLQYGKPICSDCIKPFKKNSKDEIRKKIEEIL